MKKLDIIPSLDVGERVTCTYADIYNDEDYCGYKGKKEPSHGEGASSTKKQDEAKPNDEFVSPSDVLIGKTELKPPFTSKIFRGITHAGILEIGENVIQRERQKFLKKLNELIEQNDDAWNQIKKQEQVIIAERVKQIYERIFQRKSAIFQKEVAGFYEDTLRELEEHLRSEVRPVLMSNRCSMVSDLNAQIKEKLEKERIALDQILKKKYDTEMQKVNRYYELLYQNEENRANSLVNQAIHKRNEALSIFCNQFKTEATTSTMYVMSMERKKCRMRQFLLENYQSKDIEEKLRIIEEKQKTLDEFKRNKKNILTINKDWQEKVQKILQLFLKFISYSLKLLPEQTTFLLDLEKLVVLQLNEMEKHPESSPNILVNEDNFKNLFEFLKPETEEPVCDEQPFVIEGDLASSVSTPYGSQDEIPLNKELTFFRLQRHFIYAKCQKLQQVRDFLESQRCKCHDFPKEPSVAEVSSSSTPVKTPTPVLTPESSNELFMVDDLSRLEHCPDRGCKDYAIKLGFPSLDAYVDYSEDNYRCVDTILGKPDKQPPMPEFLDPRDILRQELPFAATKERYKNRETQYSSVESLLENIPCTCLKDSTPQETASREDSYAAPVRSNAKLMDAMRQRKSSLQKIMHNNPKLVNLFAAGSEDFIL